MVYFGYKTRRLLKRITILILLMTLSMISLSMLNILPIELLVLKSPFHYSDISRYTLLFSTILKPNCNNFTEYNTDSKSYWQYYGYQHHMQLNEESLSNILKIDNDQENEISRLHDELLNKYLSTDFKLFSNLQTSTDKHSINNKGIVYVSGKNYYWLTILSIKYIRDVLKDKTPIEIFVPIKDKHDHHCNHIMKVFSSVKCTYFSDYLSYDQINGLSGYQYKSLALLSTSFNDILYLDSDNIPIHKIDDMFNNPNYLKTGFVSWPDYWKRSTNYKFYGMSGLSGFAEPISTTPSVESGQLLINKQHHLKTLLLAYYYNYYGPAYFYPLFSQGFPGEGDKETFYLASRVVKENSYLITGHKTKSFGYKNKQGSYTGQGILQVNPNDFNKYWFLHINYPKLDILQMYKSGFFENKSRTRYWDLIRNAQADGKEQAFKKTLGFDYEFEIWKLMVEILQTDFKGFRLFEEIGNDEIADYVKIHLESIENSKIDYT